MAPLALTRGLGSWRRRSGLVVLQPLLRYARSQRLPGIALRDHRANSPDVRRGGLSRHVLAADLFGLREFAVEREHQRQVLPYPGIGARARRRLAQRVLGEVQLLGQRIRKPEIVQNVRLFGRDLERLAIEPLRAWVIVEAVVDRALDGQNLPIRTFGG